MSHSAAGETIHYQLIYPQELPRVGKQHSSYKVKEGIYELFSSLSVQYPALSITSLESSIH